LSASVAALYQDLVMGSQKTSLGASLGENILIFSYSTVPNKFSPFSG